MRLNNLLGNRKTQTRVVTKLTFGAFGIKPLKDLCESLIWDARACIFDDDQDAIFTAARPNTDSVAIFAERNCVGNEIDKDLGQTPLKALHDNGLVRQIRDIFDPFCVRLTAQKFVEIAHQFQKIERFLFLIHKLAIQSRRVGNIADQAVKAADVMLNYIQQRRALVITFRDPQCANRRAE